MVDNDIKNQRLPPSSVSAAIQQIDRVPLKTWIGITGAMAGAFMALMDVQITNSSLEQIEGALGATLDEGSWISTSYLTAEIVVIPMTGWLSQVFSIRWYLIVNSLLFLFFSLCCGWAWDLPSMIVFRACQGLTGGVLIPMSFTIVLLTLPPAKQSLGLALFTITASVAPAIGPTVGGWLTDNLSWQFDFYLNIIPGIIMISMIIYAIPAQPWQLQRLQQGDWWGILFMAIGLGSLEVVLEEGNRKDWFDSSLIVRLAAIAVVSLILFFWIELTHPKPFVNLRLFVRRNFGLASLSAVAFGVGLYGSIYLLPLYLSQIQGYTAMQIGGVLMWTGLPQLLIIPLLPKLMQRVDLRLLAATGFSLFAVSCFMNSQMTHDTGYEQLRWSLLIRALGQPMIILSATAIATANIEKEQAGSASGLFNVVRNMGGSIGIAILATFLTRREQFHFERLRESVSIYNPQTQERIEQMTQYFINQGADATTAYAQTLKTLTNIIHRESYVMSYNDCFYLIGIALLLSGISLLFCKKVKSLGKTAAH